MEKRDTRERQVLEREYTIEQSIEDARHLVGSSNWIDWAMSIRPLDTACDATKAAAAAMSEPESSHNPLAGPFDLWCALARLELPIDGSADVHRVRENATQLLAVYRLARDTPAVEPSTVGALRRQASRSLAAAKAIINVTKWKRRTQYRTQQRRSALAWLRDRLGWTDREIATLIRASSTDWTQAPCPRFVSGFNDRNADDDGHARLVSLIAKDKAREK